MQTSEIIFSADALTRVDLPAILSSSEERGTYDTFVLRQAAEKAAMDGDNALAGTLHLLAAAASPMLQASSDQKPFRPLAEMSGLRSPLPEDFSREQIAAFAATLDSISDPELKARLADIVWLRRSELNARDAGPRAARTAVEAYVLAAAAHERAGRFDDAAERLERAVRLSLLIGRKYGDLASLACTSFVELAKRTAEAKEFGWLLRQHCTLYDLHLGEASDHAALLEKAAEDAASDPATSPEIAIECLSQAAEWWRRAGEREREEMARLRAVDAIASLAERHARGNGYLVAVGRLEEAIGMVRRLPKEVRGGRDEAWLKLLRGWQPRVRDAVGSVRTEIDVGEIVAHAEAAVAGKGLRDAIDALVHMVFPDDPDKVRARVIEAEKGSPLAALFFNNVVVFDEGGKTVRRIRSSGDDALEPSEQALRFRIVHEKNSRQDLVAKAVIEPACQIIVREHVITSRILLPLVFHSPFIPAKRALSWARGLAAGFAGDLTLAVHLLLPQVEHGLRELLREEGVDVATFDKFGQQENWNLNQILLDKGRQHCERILGSALTLDLSALLVEPTGVNLRNRVAHGLVPDGGLEGGPSRYFFWQALHLCFAARRVPIEVEQSTGDEKSGEEDGAA